jgi:hypothetical protein
MGQNIHRRLVADLDIYPNNGVLTFEQPWEFRNLMSLDTRITDEQDIHNLTAFHALDSIHARGRRACRRNQAYHAQAGSILDDLRVVGEVLDRPVWMLTAAYVACRIPGRPTLAR